MLRIARMLTMQPLLLSALGKGADGFQSYRVSFETGDGEVEYVFTVDDRDIPVVRAADEYTDATLCDPFAPSLYKAILNFHSARRTAASSIS
jgi:hypothetical protein